MADLRDAGYPSDQPRPDPSDGGARDAGDAGDASASDAGEVAGDLDASASDAGNMDATTGMDATLPDPTSDAGDDDGGAMETRPMVTVLSPAPSANAEDGPVLSGASVSVQCAAFGRQGRGISSVMIAIYEGDGDDPGDDDAPKVEVPGNYGGDGGYGNTMVSLANVATGPVRIRCTATDDVTDAQSAYAEVRTFYDGGPIVTFDGITEGKIYARGGANDAADINVKFRVTPARLSTMPPDPDAEIDTVTLSLNEKTVPALGAPTDGVYAREVDFYDFFNKASVDRVAVEVVASNLRGVTVRKKVNILLDGVGPQVEIVEPARVGDLPPFVGGNVTVRAKASDALAGLAAGSIAIITDGEGQGHREYVLTEVTPGVLAFEFATDSFADRSQINVQFQVRDVVGNMTEVSHSMRIDTVAPWVSLDPPSVRFSPENSNNCSYPFDPLGNTPRDGQIVQRQARFRALLWERATITGGATELYMSGVRNDSVYLVAQRYPSDPSTGRPLLVDRDGDMICDIVDDSPLAAGQITPFRVALRPVSTGGTAPDGEGPPFMFDPIPPTDICTMPIRSGAPPAPKCSGNDMSYVVSHTAVSRDQVVYGYEPTSAAPACTGASLDFGGAAGWYCVTTIARDRAGAEGNLGIAPPIRVCRKLEDGDCGGALPGSIVTPPAGLTCTDGCTLPTVWNTPAMPRVLTQ